MSFSPATDFDMLTARELTEYTLVHKFGRNDSVGTTLEPVCMGAVYQTPQPASATALRVKAGNVNDTAAGSGAREITLIGVDETGAEVTETLATAGTSASSNTSATFIRLYRAYVSSSGTYATTSTGSHAADIVIEDSAGANDWLTIDSTIFPGGQSEVAAYTIPLGKIGFVRGIDIQAESTKPCTIIMFRRSGILAAAAPYEALRVVGALIGVENSYTLGPQAPFGPFEAGTDIVFMAEVTSGSASVSVDFEVWLL